MIAFLFEIRRFACLFEQFMHANSFSKCFDYQYLFRALKFNPSKIWPPSASFAYLYLFDFASFFWRQSTHFLQLFTYSNWVTDQSTRNGTVEISKMRKIDVKNTHLFLPIIQLFFHLVDFLGLWQICGE